MYGIDFRPIVVASFIVGVFFGAAAFWIINLLIQHIHIAVGVH